MKLSGRKCLEGWPEANVEQKWRPKMAICFCTINLITLAILPTTAISLQNERSTPVHKVPRTFRLNGQLSQLNTIKSNERLQSRSDQSAGLFNERRLFVIQLLEMLHQQYGDSKTTGTIKADDRQSSSVNLPMMTQLLEALGAEGDAKRLLDWVQNSFNLASIGEVTTQFVVSKLGAVNCPALLRADKEETLVPRFLLFNEHYVDVPYELGINPSANECKTNAKFDPERKTMVLVHGYLAGYTLVDGVTNIKNRFLDLNQLVNERAPDAFVAASRSGNASYVFSAEIDAKIRSQLYNVIIVDWFNGANPNPRSNYIRAAVNAQVVGKLIARFLSALIVQCSTPAANIQLIAHSLGCHVSGFTGKAMNAAGHRLGRITHLDPVGLCFGRLFSRPHLRLSPNDALDTQAVHTSLNVFDNPLDGVHSNFLVNGGRDQPGCGGSSELKNSTSSSISLLFDPAAKFAPCSHLRALSLFEDDHSSEPNQCQLVGYRCENFDRFLAGKCGHCDSINSQCRLMSVQPMHLNLRKTNPSQLPASKQMLGTPFDIHYSHHLANLARVSQIQSGMIADRSSLIADLENQISKQTPSLQANSNSSQQLAKMYGAPAYIIDSSYAAATAGEGANDLARRLERHLVADQSTRIVQVLGKLRADTRSALADSLINWRINSREPPTDLEGRQTVGPIYSVQPDSDESKDNKLTSPGAASTTTSQTQSPPQAATTSKDEDASQRAQADAIDQVPIGGQPIPAGSLNMPLYYLGTSNISPYCVNYYQMRILIAESRLLRVLQSQGLASNRMAPQISHHNGGLVTAAANMQLRAQTASGRDMLHLTVKLTDSQGHFFKGFSLLEHSHWLPRVNNELDMALDQIPAGLFTAAGANEPLIEITMLLNSTRPEPVKVSESILSYYFHPIVLADRIEINYMSNISPNIRARYSSMLCPVAINDRYQLVRYVECHKVGAAKA